MRHDAGDSLVDGDPALDQSARLRGSTVLVVDDEADYRDMMPHVDGIGVHRYLQATHPELARKLVFASGGIVGERMVAEVSDTACPLLNKPFAPEQILRLVHGA